MNSSFGFSMNARAAAMVKIFVRQFPLVGASPQ